MPDSKKISGLDMAGTLTGPELVPLVQGAGNVRSTVRDIANFEFITPQQFGAISGAPDNTAAFNTWFAAILSSGKPGYIPPGTYACTSALYWDLSTVATAGVKVFGAGVQRSIIDLSSVSSGPALLIGGNTDLFFSSLRGFGVQGNLAGTVLQFGHYTAPSTFPDPMNVFDLDLWVSNASNNSAACAVEFNYYLNSPFTNLTANTGGAGDPVKLRQAVFNNFHGSWSTGRCGVHWVDDGYSYGNVFHAVDFENVVGNPFLCDSDNASNQFFLGGTVVWHNGDTDGGAALMNKGNNNFRFVGTQFSRNDAGSIYPIATGARAAVVQVDTEIVGTFDFEAINVAPRSADAAYVVITPSGHTGSVLFKDATDKAMWQLVTGDGYGDPLNITRFDASGASIDNPFSLDPVTGLLTLAEGLATSVGSKVGLFGAVPAVQPGAAGSGSPAAAGSGGAVLTDTTFTGGIGSTAYTLGQIVAALKTIGAIAS